MAIIQSTDMMFTSFEPKLQNRFLMDIEGIPAYLIKKVARPIFSSNTVVLDHINTKRRIKGKSSWESISCDLYDPVTPSGAQAVMEWIRLGTESVTGRDGYSDFYKKEVRIQTLGPVGDVVEEWILKGAFCSNATFGDMDWSSDNPVNINITIQMDYAILNY